MAIQGAVQGEGRAPPMSHMQRASEGPADIIAKGIPWPDAEHSETIEGIPVASDIFLFQKQQTGSGAFGYFECTKDVTDLTKDNLLSSVGEKTPIFRFSTVTPGREYADEARNPCDFAIKFYTMEGNYDIVGLNFPVFFCRDPIQGPDVIRSQWRNPKNFLFYYDAIFELLGNTPEGNHAGLMFFSDYSTPMGWCFNHGYGRHTFKWVNVEGKFVYIKYHFIAEHGQKQFTQQEATQCAAKTPTIPSATYGRPSRTAKRSPEKPTCKSCSPKTPAQKLGFDPFDNPENYHRDVEQAAFSPGSMVPGIEDSPNPRLQFRMFFYRDAQYHRIGVNLHQVHVNCPFMAKSYASLNFDGNMRVGANHAGNKQYAPNSFAHKFRPDVAEAPYQVSDNIMSRKSHYWPKG
ncbi:heme-dependent catalase [Lentithecium fluviatile CBS 122367]|uniref:Heme-dependent catalase n=1 Tax=Lentithecium fluviatile CBS 122367 TaxID=1168545 RepID=A0A6G1IMK6_9PLEO|nr:heme-dependent catalase [Lentithecium fluviatile CBS 122367]